MAVYCENIQAGGTYGYQWALKRPNPRWLDILFTATLWSAVGIDSASPNVINIRLITVRQSINCMPQSVFMGRFDGRL